MKRLAGALVALPLALPLSACLSLGSKPPAYYITLTSTQPLAATAGSVVNPATTIMVRFPNSAPAIDTTRVPVYESDARLTYVAGAQWNDPPARLFHRLVTEQIESAGRRTVVDARSEIRAASILTGHLQRFGVDATTGQATVIYDAMLSSGETVHTRRFEAQVPVSKIDAANVGPALNQAANQVASDITQWVDGR